MSEPIPCPACSADVAEDDLCPCRDPLCWNCCHAGEHYWPARDYYEMENTA